jgi:hypothetical protein
MGHPGEGARLFRSSFTRCDGFTAVLLLRLNGRFPGLAAVCAGNRRCGLA